MWPVYTKSVIDPQQCVQLLWYSQHYYEVIHLNIQQGMESLSKETWYAEWWSVSTKYSLLTQQNLVKSRHTVPANRKTKKMVIKYNKCNTVISHHTLGSEYILQWIMYKGQLAGNNRYLLTVKWQLVISAISHNSPYLVMSFVHAIIIAKYTQLLNIIFFDFWHVVISTCYCGILKWVFTGQWLGQITLVNWPLHCNN